MFQFTGSGFYCPIYSGSDNTCSQVLGSPIRISTDLCSLAAPRSFSQLATSFFASWHQGIPRTPFVSWPNLRAFENSLLPLSSQLQWNCSLCFSLYALFKEPLTEVGRQTSDVGYIWNNRLHRLIQYYLHLQSGWLQLKTNLLKRTIPKNRGMLERSFSMPVFSKCWNASSSASLNKSVLNLLKRTTRR